jgi:hypothetical protein
MRNRVGDHRKWDGPADRRAFFGPRDELERPGANGRVAVEPIRSTDADQNASAESLRGTG